MEIRNGRLELVLKLYSMPFDKKSGTLNYISKMLGDTSGTTRTFLKRLADEGVLKHVDWLEMNGRKHEVYSPDKKKILELLKENEIFRKCSAIIFEKYKPFVGDFIDWNIFSNDELGVLKEEVFYGNNS